MLSPSGFLTIGDAKLEYRVAGDPAAPPTIIMLHEGLGSAALWGDFPDRLAAATNTPLFPYSRAGYGASNPVPLPRPLSYMHDEAKDVVPALLDQYGPIRQVEVAQEECYCPVEVAMIAGAGHAPQRERPEVTLEAIAGFADRAAATT